MKQSYFLEPEEGGFGGSDDGHKGEYFERLFCPRTNLAYPVAGGAAAGLVNTFFDPFSDIGMPVTFIDDALIFAISGIIPHLDIISYASNTGAEIQSRIRHKGKLAIGAGLFITTDVALSSLGSYFF